MSEDGDAAGTPADPDEAMDSGDATDPDDRTGAGGPMDDDPTDDGGSADEADSIDGDLGAAVGPTTLGGWLSYVVAPVLIGTVVYWFISDATELEAAVFAAIMVGAVLAMDYFFDTIPE